MFSSALEVVATWNKIWKCKILSIIANFLIFSLRYCFNNITVYISTHFKRFCTDYIEKNKLNTILSSTRVGRQKKRKKTSTNVSYAFFMYPILCFNIFTVTTTQHDNLSSKRYRLIKVNILFIIVICNKILILFFCVIRWKYLTQNYLK